MPSATMPGLSPGQIKRFIVSSLRGPIEHYQRPIMLVGEPGFGKSSVVAQACHDAQVELWPPLRLQQHDPVEGSGLPAKHPDRETATWLPFAEFLPTDPDWSGVVFLDEVTQVNADWQKVIGSLLDRAGVAGRRIPPKTRFILAGNEVTNRAGAARMLSHIQQRVKQIKLLFSLTDWQEQAAKDDVHQIVRSFADFKGGAFTSFDPALDINPVPRQWYGVSDELKLHGAVDDSWDPILKTVVGSLVGPGMANEFMAFRDHYNMLHGVVDQILTQPNGCEVPTEPSVVHALVGAVSERVRGMNGDLTKRHLSSIVTFGNRLPDSFSALLVRNVLCSNQFAEQLVEIPEGISWIQKHKEPLLAARAGR